MKNADIKNTISSLVQQTIDNAKLVTFNSFPTNIVYIENMLTKKRQGNMVLAAKIHRKNILKVKDYHLKS